MKSDSRHAERAVLHGLLLWPDAMKRAENILTPADFNEELHAKLYRAALGMWKSNRPIEADLLARESGADYGTAIRYLGDLNEAPVNLKSMDEYCRIVRESAQGRRLRAILTLALESADEKACFELASGLTKSLSEFAPINNESRELLINAARFCSTIPDDIDWLVEGIIPSGSNGIISGEPKAGKSWITDELALCLAMGEDFLGKRVRRPVRTALFAREDAPGLTGWRIRALFRSRVWANPNLFGENLLVNTRKQSEQFSTDSPEQVQEVIECLRKHRIEFAIFDVLNIMHGADENDNSEMRQVMNVFTEIQTKAQCSIALVHHLGKGEGKWTRRLRGASSIHGWVEWLIGVSEVDAESRTRQLEFELKASQAPEPIHYQIESEENTAHMELVTKPQGAANASQQRFM